MSKGRLSTHVLDTARGKPAAGMKLTLYRKTADGWDKLKEAVTNADGRTEEPLLSGAALQEGTYELIFKAGDYFRDNSLAGDGVLFLDDVLIRFGVPDANQGYHVPLLISPFSYSTYRGS
jgi:5-hydroxyisourate hydrolase